MFSNVIGLQVQFLNLHKEVLSLCRVRTQMTWQLAAPPLVGHSD